MFGCAQAIRSPLSRMVMTKFCVLKLRLVQHEMQKLRLDANHATEREFLSIEVIYLLAK